MTLQRYKTQFEQFLETQKSYWEGNDLGAACLYALSNGGKRIRPVIVYLVAEVLGNEGSVDRAALATEYFHTASLIADDLPCMDNDSMRRGVPALHKQFDEPTALLASYALITAAFEAIHDEGEENPSRALVALKLAAESSGFHGATGGQFLDLKSKPASDDDALEILYKKTVTLFEVAFGFGYLFGGGDLERYPLVKKAGYHFGMSFQIADDLADYEQDAQKLVNVARRWGRPKARSVLECELVEFRKALSGAGLEAPEFDDLCEKITYLAAGALF